VISREMGRALLVDLGPTLLELAGVAPRGALDGISLVPALRGARIPARTTVTRFQPAGYAIVSNDRYELVYNPDGEPLVWPGELKRHDEVPRLGLYDRARDPKEEHDLSPEEPLIAGALRAEAMRTAAGAAAPLSTEARQLLKQAGYADDD
jgi:arylsulfatase A-like enzyme